MRDMKFCTNCGSEVADNAFNCGVCGTAMDMAPQQNTATQMNNMQNTQAYYNPQATQMPANNQQWANQPMQQTNSSSTIPILSIVFAIFEPVIGLVLSIIGLCQSKQPGPNRTKSFIGLIISIVLIMLPALIFIIFGSFVEDIILEILEELYWYF